MEKKIVIIGAGATGLGASYKLKKLGYKNWAIYEKNNYIGGLCASFKDSRGFTWDIGGHVIFSRYKYFKNVIENLMGNDYFKHQRKSWIRVLNRWVPYPFQNNIRYLPKDALLECLIGLYKASINFNKKSHNFKEWIINIFGEGIAKYFMFPYNLKMWASHLEQMDKEWIADRVSSIDFERALTNVILGMDDVDWGPNNTFRFPLRGGTGGVYNKFLPYIKDNLFMRKEVVKTDLKNKNIRFKDGTSDRYDVLINTSPLDDFITKLDSASEVVIKAAKDLVSNSIYVVGVGIKKKFQNSSCWAYFPEDNSPFYRITYFSNYSPYNVPDGKTEEFSSYMCETSFSENKIVNKNEIIEETIQGLINTGLISKESQKLIASTYLIEVDKAYPIPTLNRDHALSTIHKFLEKNFIYSRGRFGAWRYEIGNMDHSFIMGVECIDSILNGKKEEVFKSKSI